MRLLQWLFGERNTNQPSGDASAPVRPSDKSLRDTFGVPDRLSARGESSPVITEALHIGKGHGGFNLKVVGESYYQPTLSRLFDEWRHAQLKGRLHVSREPGNQYDTNAIAVMTADGEKIGHFSRSDAAEYAPVLDRLSNEHSGFYCVGRLTGGDGLHVGVVLDVQPASQLSRLHPKTLQPKRTASAGLAYRHEPIQHGQPATAINYKKRAERDVSEILGIVKGLLADGVLNDDELQYLNAWGQNHPDALRRWPANALFARLQHYYADGRIEDDERADLLDLMSQLVGGRVSMVLGADAPTSIPIDDPPPELTFNERVFVLTGRFAYGTRATCTSEILGRGGQIGQNVTKKTSFLVLGTFGSDDWMHSSYGRKIERACELRSAGHEIWIVTEDYWAASL